MLVIGAKGMAKEILQIISVEMQEKDSNILFFDNINDTIPDLLYNRFKVLKTFDEVSSIFKNDESRSFCLGLGNPHLRDKMAAVFLDLGGKLTSIISKHATIGDFGTIIGDGTVIMQGVRITNDVKIGKGVLINLNSTVSHDTVIGDFVEIACGVTIPGRCTINDKAFLGSNCTLNPGTVVGKNSIIGAGSVVIDNVPENVTVVGNPARIIKRDD